MKNMNIQFILIALKPTRKNRNISFFFLSDIVKIHSHLYRRSKICNVQIEGYDITYGRWKRICGNQRNEDIKKIKERKKWTTGSVITTISISP